LLAVDRGHADRPAEAHHLVGDRDRDVDVGAVPLEDLVRGHFQRHIQVARLAAWLPGLAGAVVADLKARVPARPDPDLHVGGPAAPPRPVAGGAAVVGPQRGPLPWARRAGGADPQEALGADPLPGAAAGRALGRLRAGLQPATVAGRAFHPPRHRDLLRDA